MKTACVLHVNPVDWFRVLGKSLAYTRVEIFNPSGQLAAYGRESTHPLPQTNSV